MNILKIFYSDIYRTSAQIISCQIHQHNMFCTLFRICEKVCFKNELTKSYKGREVLNDYKRQLNKTPLSKRQTQVVFLSSKGEVLYVAKKAKSAGKFAQQMKLAMSKNAKAMEADAKKVAMR